MWNRQNKNGKTIWSFTMEPGEERSILFGTEIKRPDL